MTIENFKKRYHLHFVLFNNIWGIISLFVVCAMVGIFCFWLGQPQFFYAVTNSSIKPHVVSTEGDVYHPNILICGVGKAEYRQWIENRHGDTVHEYPPIILNVENGTHVQQQRITIPRLPKGLYVIKGEMVNRPNPIKVIKVDLTLGIIDVQGVAQKEADIKRVHPIENTK